MERCPTRAPSRRSIPPRRLFDLHAERRGDRRRVGNLAWANEVGSPSAEQPREVGTRLDVGRVSANASRPRRAMESPPPDEHHAGRRLATPTRIRTSDIEFGVKFAMTPPSKSWREYVARDVRRLREWRSIPRRSGSRKRDVRAQRTIFYTSATTPTYPFASTPRSTVGHVDQRNDRQPRLDDISGVTAPQRPSRRPPRTMEPGASSTQALASGDGFLEFTAVETNTRRTVGLKTGTQPRRASPTSTTRSISAPAETSKSSSLEPRAASGAYAHGDRLRVEIEGESYATSRTAPSVLKCLDRRIPPRGSVPLHERRHRRRLSMGDLVWGTRGVQLFASGSARRAAPDERGAFSSRAIDSGYVECTVSETNSDRILASATSMPMPLCQHR